MAQCNHLTLELTILLTMCFCAFSTVIPTNPPVTTTPVSQTSPQELPENQTTSTPTSGNHSATPTLNDRLAHSRILRLFTLRQHILDTLGWENPPNIDRETKQQLLLGMNTVFVTRQKFCYYPLCDLPMVDMPDYMNRSIWFDTSSRNIRYYFSLEASEDPNMEITSAVLRLHLKRREDCPCAFEGIQPLLDCTSKCINTGNQFDPNPDVVRHSNMRLIDAKMVTWNSDRWVSLQLTDAVKRIVTRGRRNGGFEVHVRDMEEHVLDAKTVIDPTVCTSTLTYECTAHEDAGAMLNENVEDLDPNYSPVLEVSSTTTRRIPIS